MLENRRKLDKRGDRNICRKGWLFCFCADISFQRTKLYKLMLFLPAAKPTGHRMVRVVVVVVAAAVVGLL